MDPHSRFVQEEEEDHHHRSHLGQEGEGRRKDPRRPAVVAGAAVVEEEVPRTLQRDHSRGRVEPPVAPEEVPRIPQRDRSWTAAEPQTLVVVAVVVVVDTVAAAAAVVVQGQWAALHRQPQKDRPTACRDSVWPVPWEEAVGEEVLEVPHHTDWGSEGRLAGREVVLLQRRKRDPMWEERPAGPRTKRVPEGELRTLQTRVVGVAVEPRRKHRDRRHRLRPEAFPPWASRPTFQWEERAGLP